MTCTLGKFKVLILFAPHHRYGSFWREIMEMKKIFWLIGIGLFIGCAEQSPSTRVKVTAKTEMNEMPKDRAQEIICK